jgi:acetyltransferase-like isoleucine patch superfamily enzyme
VNENVTFGENFRVGRGVFVSAPHRLHIGHEVSVGPWSIIQVDGAIGDFVLIGMGVQIVGRDDHALDEVGTPIGMSTWVAERDQTDRDLVTIGRDVWVGGGAVILSGVQIGEGAVIGAGSVVTKNVPPFTIVGGNPAKPLAMRFSTESMRVEHSNALDERVARIAGRS